MLTNAEKQKRWRDKRNERAEALKGKPKEIADNILRLVGPDQTRKIARALDRRLRNLRDDCALCHGTGFKAMEMTTHCGMHICNAWWPCECPEPDAAKIVVATGRKFPRYEPTMMGGNNGQ